VSSIPGESLTLEREEKWLSVFYSAYEYTCQFIFLPASDTIHTFSENKKKSTVMHVFISLQIFIRVVKLVYFKLLALSRQGLCILSYEEAIQLSYGKSVALHWCPFVPEIMYGGVSEVFLQEVLRYSKTY
jgi:hypothetical protein